MMSTFKQPRVDVETEELAQAMETCLLIKELLSQIQLLKKEIVTLRKEANANDPVGAPYPFPASDLPGSCAFCDMPAMKLYEQFFGKYIPKY